MHELNEKLVQALWKVHHWPERPVPWQTSGNLPWNDPEFSQRMLREHLDQSHDAASRSDPVRQLQIDWMWERLDLRPGARVLDVTCGPGLYAVELARRGCQVVGVDFGPASVSYARELAHREGVADLCKFVEQDVLEVDYSGADFDVALFLFGQLTVFTPQETQALLEMMAASLRPGGKLVVEILDQSNIDTETKRGWYTAEQGLWGDSPFLFLGERLWYPAERVRLERSLVIHLETGELTEVQMWDQSYSAEELVALMQTAGFKSVEVYPAWDDLSFNEVERWVVFVAEKG